MTDPSVLSLRGKTALVTGGTRGIGAAVARGLAAAGAFVWVHGRDDSGTELAHEIGGAFVRADLEAESEITALGREVLARSPRLDVLVNNAGLEVGMPLESIDLDNLDRIWKVNVRAPVQLIRDLLPALKAANGASIINITSIHQQVPYPENAAYAASKAALAMLSNTAALELARFGIRVNNVAPGVVETDINREVIGEIGHHRFKEWIPARRLGTTEDIVGPVLYLASDASLYVTGTTLFADGGYRHHLVRYRVHGDRGE